MRVAEPLQRREQALPRDRRELHAADHLAEQQRVGEHRHVPAVLFERRDREDDGRVLRQRGDRGPREVGEFHRMRSASGRVRNSVAESGRLCRREFHSVAGRGCLAFPRGTEGERLKIVERWSSEMTSVGMVSTVPSKCRTVHVDPFSDRKT